MKPAALPDITVLPNVDETMLDLGEIPRTSSKPKPLPKPPPAVPAPDADAGGLPSWMDQDESMLDMGAVKPQASAVTPEKEPLFVLELVYAGTVTLGGEVPQDAYGPLLLIETPRLLFPFARAVVANATREAGFPPLNIAPVDFVALYRQQLDAQGGQIPGVPGGQVGHA